MKARDYEKAWHELKEKYMQEYIQLHARYEQNYDFVYIAQPIKSSMTSLGRILTDMDNKDGSCEFKNLLEDLKRKS